MRLGKNGWENCIEGETQEYALNMPQHEPKSDQTV